MTVRRRLRISGTVQGVGFRPHVRRLADSLELAGAVGNDDSGVWCEIQGPADSVASFVERLRAEAPPLARIESVVARELTPTDGRRGFTIAASETGPGSSSGMVPPRCCSLPGLPGRIG